MTTTLERLDVAAGGFRQRLDGLTDDELAMPSPCEGWSARDVITHTIDAVVVIADFVGSPFDDAGGPDLTTRYDLAVANLRAKTADADLSGLVVESPFGELAFKQLVSSIVIHDLLVHTWDLARATGRDEHLDPELVAHSLAHMRPLDDALRGHGFGDKIETDDGADAQTELLCFLGRQP
jgi:uncharacterized protein (TIGR03086 family)